MFNLQVTLSDFRCRKRQYLLDDDFIIVFRFGSIKLDIKISSSYGQFIGGKRIVLDITSQQLQQMFLTYALGMFLQNKSGKFFSLLSLQNLNFKDIISGQQVYFYNDSQEIVYSASFSIVFNDFKNPRLPSNKGTIENYKTFDQMFKKPAVPSANGNLGKTTMSSFLYGNGKVGNVQGQNVKPNRPASGKPKKSTSIKGQNHNKNMAKTTTNQFNKQKLGVTINNPSPQFAQTSYPQQNINIYRLFQQEDYQQTDINPPMMQFTNTISDPQKGLGLLKTQLEQLSSPQAMKLMTAFQSKKGISREMNTNYGNKDAKNARIKIQQQFMKTKTNNIKKMGQSRGIMNDTNLITNNSRQPSSMMIKVDRQQLRNKAKQQLSTYQGNTNIKIPILKDGRYEFIQLSQLSQQQIKKFAQKQKQLQFEEQMRKQMQRQLQKKDKENQRLKKELQEKQRQMKKKQQQAKKQKEQLLKKQQQLKYNQQQQQQKVTQNQQQSQSQNEKNNYEDDSQYDYDDSQLNQSLPDQKQQQQNSPKYQQSNNQQQQQENYYESDFQSMASGLKQSKASINSSQKLKGQQSYNQSYDPDFQSYSQSFLDSKLKLSASQISQSNHYQYKKR